MKPLFHKLFAISALLSICGCAGKAVDGSVAETLSTSSPAVSRSEAPPASDPPVTLLEAIEQSAEKLVAQLPVGSRVMIAAFGSEHENISEFIMEELGAALFNSGMVLIERENMEYVMMEFEFQRTDFTDESTLVDMGNWLGADMAVAGSLFDIGDTYRYSTNAVRMETSSRAGSATITVRNDDAMKRMINALSSQTRRTRVAKDLAATAQTPETVGGFIDRGISYAARNDFDSAIADFETALQMDPDNAAAKNHIERLRAKRSR